MNLMQRGRMCAAFTFLVAMAPFCVAGAQQAKAPPAGPHQAGRPPLTARPQGDAAVVRTVIDAIGLIRSMPPRETTNTVNRLQWRGSGTLTENGRVIKVNSYVYGVSLHLVAAREDIEGTDAGKPFRRIEVVAGNDAWDESEPGVGAALKPAEAKARRENLWRTPFGIAKALSLAPAGSVKVTDPGPGGAVKLEFPVEGLATIVVLDAQYRPAQVTQNVDGHVIDTRYSDYKDLAEYGLMFATRVTESVDGKKTLDLKINDGRVASYLVFPVPANLAAAK